MMVNGMYKSIVKGLTLFTLVLMSVVLTYKIWNFKPNLVNIESSITKSSTALSPKNLDNIHGAFLPYQVVSYTNNRIYGTTNKDILLEYINSLSNKKITAISTKQLNMNYMPKGMKERFLILDFASDFPLSMYLSDILDSTFKGDVDETFNRLIVDSYSKDNLVLYVIT
ncbi:MAG: two-component system activity regulator YycH, partial [Macrococcoides caseolyticum]